MDIISPVPCHKKAHTKAHQQHLAFNTKALRRRVVGVRWYTTSRIPQSIITRTGQPSLTTITCKLRLGAFEHIMSSTTGHRHFDLHPTIIMPLSKRTPPPPHSAGLTKLQQIPSCLCSTPCWLPTTDNPEDHPCSRWYVSCDSSN